MINGPWGTIVDADMCGTLVRILAVLSSVEMLFLV